MKISISPQVLRMAPGYARFVVVARGIRNSAGEPEVAGLLKAQQESVRSDVGLEQVRAAPPIAAWREALRQFGADPDEAPPSVEALVSGVRDGRTIGYRNTVVALLNSISLKHVLPCGGDDLDKVEGDLTLSSARGDELFVAFDGNRVERPVRGEVVLADKRKVLCRRWVWKQGVHTTIDVESENVAINVDVLPPVGRDVGQRAAEELAGLLRRLVGGEVTIHLLDAEHPEEELPEPTHRRAIQKNVYDVLEERGYIEQTSDRAAVRELLGKGTTLYEGFDPTKPSLHIGHLMSLMALHYLQEAGNKLIYLNGGGTAQVGDPSDKARARKMMTVEEVRANARAIREQVQASGLVDFENDWPGRPKAILLDNSDWLNMPLLEYAREVTVHFSVNELVKRETFRDRLEKEEPLSLFELLYTTLQGFDFLHLFDEYGCRVQMGGNDQWANITDGVALVKRKRGQAVCAVTVPLLTRNGEKIGKTAGGEAVWLAAPGPARSSPAGRGRGPEPGPEGEAAGGESTTSPFDFFQYWVQTPDAEVGRMLRLFTFLTLEEIDDILAGDPRLAQRRLAFEVTRIVHGDKAALKAQEEAGQAFADKGGLPDGVPTVMVTQELVKGGLLLRQVLKDGGAAPSMGEAKRLLVSGAVQVNGKKVDDPLRALTVDDLLEYGGQRGALVRFGKGKVIVVLLQQ